MHPAPTSTNTPTCLLSSRPAALAASLSSSRACSGRSRPGEKAPLSGSTHTGEAWGEEGRGGGVEKAHCQAVHTAGEAGGGEGRCQAARTPSPGPGRPRRPGGARGGRVHSLPGATTLLSATPPSEAGTPIHPGHTGNSSLTERTSPALT